MTAATDFHSTVGQFEARAVRWAAAVFPVLGGLAGLAWGAHGWHAIALDARYARPFASPAGLRFAALGAVLGVALWAGWAFGLARMRRRAPGARGAGACFSLPLALALAGLVGMDVASRQGGFQTPFWLAVRARLQPGDAEYFVRELAYWRLDAAGPAARATQAIVVAGSSQVLHGIDVAKLAEWTGAPVKRRALAGMDPIKAAGAQEWLQVRAGDTLVLYLSEFDLAGDDRLNLNWMRPMTGPQGARTVIASLRRPSLTHQWRQVVDLAVASHSELWRLRDYVSQLAFRPFGAVQTSRPGGTDPLRVQAEQYAAAMTDSTINQARVACLRRLVQAIGEAGGSVVIFEGQVNPSLVTAGTQPLREQARAALASLSVSPGCTFVPVSEQKVGIAPDDWLDGTHLNVRGREKLTRVVARFLLERKGSS